jgi:hypothetical protein
VQMATMCDNIGGLIFGEGFYFFLQLRHNSIKIYSERLISIQIIQR